MTLFIHHKHKKFVTEQVPVVLKGYINKYYHNPIAQHIDKYLRENGIGMTTKELMNYSIDTLQAVSIGTGYMLKINKNRIPPGSKYNIETLVKLITYGTVDVRGYPLLRDAFKFIEENATRILKVYLIKQEQRGGK